MGGPLGQADGRRDGRLGEGFVYAGCAVAEAIAEKYRGLTESCDAELPILRSA